MCLTYAIYFGMQKEEEKSQAEQVKLTLVSIPLVRKIAFMSCADGVKVKLF